ncbi:hypothetical protein AB0D54_38735 [Streptomyces xanthophaeus]|uniref:hypothetical protein n=1 Tax=Streptomyces xanthophaeus TaxID=67385 RepID=UPI00344AE495
MSTTTTTTTSSAQAETSETAEQQLTRLRRQRDVLVGSLGLAFALGVLLAVRLAPSWADPVDAALTALGVYAAIAVPYLLLRR